MADEQTQLPQVQALQGDSDFMSAHPNDQTKYLSQTDPDFAAAKPEDQAAYLAHVTKAPEAPKTPGVLDKADASITGALAPTAKEGPVLASAKTLGREVYSGAKTLAGMPAGIAEAFTSPPQTAQEKEWATGHPYLGKTAIGLGRIVGEPIQNAAQWYGSALKGRVPNAYEQALSVAPEAIGSGAVNALVGELAPKVVEGAGEYGSQIASKVGPRLNEALGSEESFGPKSLGFKGRQPATALARIEPPRNAAGESYKPAARSGEALGTIKGAPKASALETVPTPAARPARESGVALGGPALRSALQDAYTPAAVPARESGETLGTIKPNKGGGLGSAYTPSARPASETGEALGYGKATPVDRPITAADIKSSPGTSMSPEGKQPVDKYPVRVKYTPEGDIVEGDGRHRVIAAIKNGEDRIQVQVDRGNGPVTTSVDPKVLAKEMGVTEESLKNTDEQQGREGKPREAVPAEAKVGSAETTKNDNVLWQRAKGELNKELGREPTFGEINDRTTAMKAAPEQPKYRRPNPFEDKEGARETVANDAYTRRAGDVKAEEPAKEEPKVPLEDRLSAKDIIMNLTDQDIIKAGQAHEIDHAKYDFNKRSEPSATSSGRHRVERDQYAQAVAEKLPEDMVQKLLKAEKDFDSKENFIFPEKIRSGASKAERAKAIWEKAHSKEE